MARLHAEWREVNRVKKVSRLWEEQREACLRVHHANKRDTNKRRVRYRTITPTGDVQGKIVRADFAGHDITDVVDSITLNKGIDVLVDEGLPAGPVAEVSDAPTTVSTPWSSPASDPVGDVIAWMEKIRNTPSEPFKPIELEDLTVENLRRCARAAGLKRYSKATKAELIAMINDYIRSTK